MTPQDALLGHLIRRLHQKSTAVFSDAMATLGHDITPMQFSALNALVHHDGIDQARLAEHVAVDRATLGGIVDRLEKKGLIERRVAPNDRRARILSLTVAGRALFEALEPEVIALQGHIAGDLTAEDQEQLRVLILKALSSA